MVAGFEPRTSWWQLRIRPIPLSWSASEFHLKVAEVKNNPIWYCFGLPLSLFSMKVVNQILLTYDWAKFDFYKHFNNAKCTTLQKPRKPLYHFRIKLFSTKKTKTKNKPFLTKKTAGDSNSDRHGRTKADHHGQSLKEQNIIWICSVSVEYPIYIFNKMAVFFFLAI